MKSRPLNIAGVVLLAASVVCLFLAWHRYQVAADEVRRVNEFQAAKRPGTIEVSFETSFRPGFSTGEIQPYLPTAATYYLAGGLSALAGGVGCLVLGRTRAAHHVRAA